MFKVSVCKNILKTIPSIDDRLHNKTLQAELNDRQHYNIAEYRADIREADGKTRLEFYQFIVLPLPHCAILPHNCVLRQLKSKHP